MMSMKMCDAENERRGDAAIVCYGATRRVTASLILRVKGLSKSKEALDRDVFVQRFPVDPESASEQLPIVAFFRRRLKQTRIPFERDRDLTAVGERYVKLIAVTRHVDRKGLNLNG